MAEKRKQKSAHKYNNISTESQINEIKKGGEGGQTQRFNQPTQASP